MKKIIVTGLALFALSFANAQDSKAYLGVSAGVALPMGSDLDNLKTGINLGFINFGYRFSETWGATVNLASSGFSIKDETDVAVGIGSFSIGPMYTVSVAESMSLDIKPQYAFSMAAKTKGFDQEVTNTGSGLVLGTSLNFGITKGLKFSLNLDYTNGKFNKEEYGGQKYDIDDIKVSILALGAGVRYNF